MFQSLVVAALSGCVNVLLTSPIWVVVTRMQTHKKCKRIPHAQDETTHIAAIESPPYGASDVFTRVLQPVTRPQGAIQPIAASTTSVFVVSSAIPTSTHLSTQHS